MNTPNKAWQPEYEKKIALLSETSDFAAYFNPEVVNIGGVAIDRFSLSKVSVPSGKFL